MHDIVFFLDFDNTILDNDSLKQDLDERMREILGPDHVGAFWSAYEEVRDDVGVIDFFETGRRLEKSLPGETTRVRAAVEAIMAWDFRPRLQPRAVETVEYLNSLGLTMIISDGDPIFQPMKIWQSGLTEAVDGRVLIFGHKEERIVDVAARFPARTYVLVDDKPRVLAACKQRLGERLTTVLMRFGHYGLAADAGAEGVDVAIDRFDELQAFGVADFTRGQSEAMPAS